MSFTVATGPLVFAAEGGDALFEEAWEGGTLQQPPQSAWGAPAQRAAVGSGMTAPVPAAGRAASAAPAAAKPAAASVNGKAAAAPPSKKEKTLEAGKRKLEEFKRKKQVG